MQETGNNHTLPRLKNRLVIRVSRSSMSFSVADPQAEAQIVYEPYAVKSGVSMAANLREAFGESTLLTEGYQRARLLIDSPVLLHPSEEFNETLSEALYQYTFKGHEGELVLNKPMAEQDVVASFGVNRDLKLVLDDHFADLRITPVSLPAWNFLYRRSFTGPWKKLFGYFHDRKLDIVCFQKNRFKFANTYDTESARDAVYFLLYVWKQLGLDAERDELHLAGNTPQSEWLTGTLKKYVQKVFIVNPSAEFNRAPITQIKELPFDLLTTFVSKS